MIVSTPHISGEGTLAQACALLIESGASSLIIDGPAPKLLTLEKLRTLLVQLDLPLTQRLHDLPKSFTSTLSSNLTTTPLTLASSSVLTLLQSAVKANADAIYVKDIHGSYLFANEGYAQALGQPVGNIIGATDAAIHTPALARQARQLDSQILRSGDTKTFQEDIANEQGVSTYLTTKGPLHVNGQLLGIYGFARNTEVPFYERDAKNQEDGALEAIFQSLPDLFFRLAADGTILDYRTHAEAELYKPASEFLGKRMQDVLPKDLGEQFSAKLAEHKATGQLLCYEYELDLPKEKTRFEARLSKIKGSSELIVLVRNITKQHNEQVSLINVTKQLEMALEAAKEGVWDWNVISGIWTANEQFFTMLGYAPETEPQPIHHWNEKVHPNDVERRNQAYKSVLDRDRDNLDVEFRVVNQQGQYQWIRAKGKVVEVGLDNRAHRLVGIHEDITERRKLEEKLKLAATVFRNTAEGVIIADPKGYIIDVNQGFEDVTNFSREEVIGKHIRLLNAGRQAPAFYRSMWRELSEHGCWKGEIWSKRKDGSLVPEWLNVTAVKDDNDITSHFVAVFSDISVLKRSEEKLDHMAHHDALTSLPNRLMLQARMGRALVHAHRNKHSIALLFLDIDRFKNINDSMGHQAGDSLLKQVATRLKTCVRTEDTVARLGGDEFVVLLENITDINAPAHIAEKILLEIRKPFELDNDDYHSTTSIGISLYPTDATSPSELLRNADTAMYQVKQTGRDNFAFYTQRLTDAARKKAEMETELHRALAKNEMQLWYQPQFNLDTEEMIGMEALIRWIHPVKGLIPPDLFIPLAEESGLIIKIGEWVINQSCQQIRSWRDNKLIVPRVGINVSGSEMRQGDLIKTLCKALEQYQLPGSALEVEITENFMLDDIDRAVRMIEELKAMGIEVAVDDFGTGYSSLSYLKSLPIRRLKIDKSFVIDIPKNKHDMAITKAIIAMGHSLGLEIIAEGVETREQQKFLRDNNCVLGQGYLFCRPVNAEKIEQWLAKDSE